MSWVERMQELYQERGYLVIARVAPYTMGEIVLTVNLPNKADVPLPQPFYVMSETDQADYEAQHRSAGEQWREYFATEQPRFYRIMTD